MAGLKLKYKASALLECIVASVILLVVFLGVMEILVRFFPLSRENEEMISVEAALNRVLPEYKKPEYPPGCYAVTYKGGNIEIEIKPYRCGLRELVFTAIPEKTNRRIIYHYLIE